MINKTQSQP